MCFSLCTSNNLQVTGLFIKNSKTMRTSPITQSAGGRGGQVTNVMVNKCEKC